MEHLLHIETVTGQAMHPGKHLVYCVALSFIYLAEMRSVAV